jgi:hypothetical protein
MPDVVINLNFVPRVVPVAETRQRDLEIEPQSYQLEPESIRYLIYEGLTPLDIFQYRESSQGKGKAGKQCKTGQACGNSCISKTKTCRKGLNGAQKQKAKTAKSKTTAKGKSAEADAITATQQKQDVKNIPLDKLPKVYTGEGLSAHTITNKIISTSKGDIGITVYAGYQYATKDNPLDPLFEANFDSTYGADKPRAPVYDFSYTVNDTYSKIDLPPKDAARVGREVMTTYRDVLKDIPDGSIVSATAYDNDGNGNYRQRIYEKAGFGPPADPDYGGTQYAMVVSGKLRPLTEDEYVTLLNKALPD